MSIPRQFLVLLAAVFACLSAAGQQSASTTAEASGAVPPLVNFAGTLSDINGEPIGGVTGVTFLLYKDQQGGSPLWMETQTVTSDQTGRYSVTLGSGSAAGLPMNLFAAGESRWLAVQPHGEPEQPRILLLSVPYALKAGDASTVGGLPASAFMLANSSATTGKTSTPTVPAATSSLAAKSAPPANPAVTGKGTLDFIPMWDSASDIINSVIFQKTSEIGISTTTPAAPLDVNGKTDIRDTLTLFPKSTDSTLSVSGTSFKVSSTGLVTFISGQTFPGTGKGTITGITTATGSGLSGGGTTGTLSLKVPTAGITNAMLQNSKVTLNASTAGGLTAPGAMTLGSTYTVGLKTCSTNQVLQYTGTAWNCATLGGTGTITGVTAGADLTGGGTTGSVTLNLDTTKVPLLAAANTFSGTDRFNANVGIGAAPFTNTYTPLALGGATTFGTWLSLANTSTGGHTWNFLSAGSGNAEGAGNLGITDLTGTSTIWLEGNANVTQNLAVTGSSGGSIIDADYLGANAGTGTPGLRFGGSSSGETIASNRGFALNRYGLDFYTEFLPRFSITQSGQAGLGTQLPKNQLDVVGATTGYYAIYAQGGNAVDGSDQTGGGGIEVFGGNGDLSAGCCDNYGGDGLDSYGGSGTIVPGAGGVFFGGPPGPYSGQFGGDGIVAFPGGATADAGPYAGYFPGDVAIIGDVVTEVAAMRIDHPLDPANKYLFHAAVQSPDMMNIYNGNVVTDASGEAVVNLPDWFETLNRDFRYQLTAIGQQAQAWISSEIANRTFAIKTDKPNVKISWQVTGIRQDAWANAHRTSVEMEKPDREKGFYLHPELYGAPEEKATEWARIPEIMKRRRAMQLHPAGAEVAAKGATRVAPAKH